MGVHPDEKMILALSADSTLYSIDRSTREELRSRMNEHVNQGTSTEELSRLADNLQVGRSAIFPLFTI
jgi:hypothetical protein